VRSILENRSEQEVGPLGLEMPVIPLELSPIEILENPYVHYKSPHIRNSPCKKASQLQTKIRPALEKTKIVMTLKRRYKIKRIPTIIEVDEEDESQTPPLDNS